MRQPFFNAHHSPVGAFASFTLGLPGAKGGFGLELGKPAEQNLYIGCTEADGTLRALPFYSGSEDERARYETEKVSTGAEKPALRPFAREEIRRDFGLCTDTWTAGDLTFRILSPFLSAPKPKAPAAAQKFAFCPAVLAELTLDNSRGEAPRQAFFGWQGNDPYSNMRCFAEDDGVGVAQGLRIALASRDKGVEAALAFDIESAVRPAIPENRRFGLGGVGALVGAVPAGAKRTFRFAVCFHRGGIVTTGLDCTYWYARWFDRLETVAAFALANFSAYAKEAARGDRLIDRAGLSEDRAFQMRHAIRAYYGSTEYLAIRGRPFWVVNEGEYRMMNTFDLTVDHLFFEMRMNPWTVRNELDFFVDRYSYRDRLHFPHGDNDHPGGLSFTHDMGIGNCISPAGTSAYELHGLDGCFSHMTHEQLVNWVLCAAVYIEGTRDRAWAKKRRPVLEACLESLVRRDHPDPKKRTGLMKLDSSRTLRGAEITTYDSLDQSLGQARGNLYMAVKAWAAYLALEKLLGGIGRPKAAAEAAEQARRAAATIEAAAEPDGLLPAVIGENCRSRILPAIEGLVFPARFGRPDAVRENGPFAGLVAALKRHFTAALVPGTCLFPDGGWKLSSTSDNSWLSKIYLCQHVAETVLGLPEDATSRKADATHVAWLTHPELSYWSWSDQIVAGRITGSKYYPRGVTCILWLEE